MGAQSFVICPSSFVLKQVRKGKPMKKTACLMIMATVAASATLPAETFTVGDWELTGGGNAAITL